MSKGAYFCCICCVLFIATPVLLIIFLLPVHHHRSSPKPGNYIQELYVPALDLSLENTSTTHLSNSSKRTLINPTLFFDISLKSDLGNCKVQYNYITLSFYYGGQNAVGTYVIHSYHKGGRAYHRDVVEIHGVPWDDALRIVSKGSKVVFRVNLTANWPQYSCKDIDTHTTYTYDGNTLGMGADVEVDGTGMKVEKGYIGLITPSAASKSGLGISARLVFVVLMSMPFM